MPFDKNGIWTQPTARDIEDFRRQLTEKEAVTAEVTPNMLQALATGLNESPITESNVELFNAISRLEGGADIVIPVYAGLHVLKPCIDSILTRTNWHYRLIIVDDCSPDPITIEYLKGLKEQGVTVLFNNNNRGFAATVNRGVNEGSNPYVVVLNSDTLVTENWLTKMLIAMESNPLNVICNPATNNTAMINVNMYPGRSYLDMAGAMDKMRDIRNPDAMPTGFCFMFRRGLWDLVGPLDEAYGSYGEESDFWFKSIRLTDAEGNIIGYRGIVADNAYVYHERGTSFSQLGVVSHLKQRKAGSERFNLLHPEFREWVKGYKADDAIGHLRAGIPRKAFSKDYKGNVAWLVKSAGPCGGMFFITDIANQLIEDGYNVKICVIPDDQSNVDSLPVVANLHTQPIYFASSDDFLTTFEEKCFANGVLIAAVTEMTPTVYTLARRNKNIVALNHVQSWDIDLAERVKRPDLVEQFTESYKRVPNVVSSTWVADEVRKVGGKVVSVVHPGVNPLLFHNRDRAKNDDRFTVGVMLLQSYPFKGFNEGVAYCQKLVEIIKTNGLNMRVVGIGIDALLAVPGVKCLGQLSQSKMADVLGNEIDVFVDPAHIHSYGLPALEALISGCRAVTLNNKGVYEYATSWGPKIAVADDVDEMVQATLDYYHDEKYQRGVTTEQVREFSRGAAVEQFISTIFPPEAPKRSERIEVITPHLRKHGGPTTNIALANAMREIGHKVTMSMIYTDWNPEVFNMAKCKIGVKWDHVPSDAGVVIMNSDLGTYAEQLMERNPGFKYVMYKLSHNERFKEEEQKALALPWHHIITSTGWLKEACHTVTEGWEYPTWPANKVSVVGWYHYGHENFNCDPRNRTYGDATSGFRVGTLIHGHPLKGTQEAIAAAQGLKRKYGNYCHIVGVGEQKAKLPPFVQFIFSPNRQDLAHIFRQLDVWFGASHTEGLGRMALEAMSSGVPVVTTDTGAEFLVDGENCLLYPVGDAQAGAECVNRLVQDKGLITKLAINGYDTARKAADSTDFKAAVNKVLLEVIDGQS